MSGMVLAACGSSEAEVPTVGGDGGGMPASEMAVASPVATAAMESSGEVVADSGSTFPNAPEEWPADMPIPEGGSLVSYTVPFENQVKAAWQIPSTTPNDALAAYQEALALINYSEGTYDADEKGGRGEYRNDERTVSITAYPKEDGSVELYVEHTFN